MNELQIFNSELFGDLSVIDIEGKPYFIGNEVAEKLGYSRPADAVARHCKGSLKHRLLTAGGEQETKIISEGDLYRLIIRSNLKEADTFEKWVFDEVIPSIRKTGGYVANVNREELSPETRTMMLLVEGIARTELEQKRQAQKIDALETTVDNIKEVIVKPIGDWKNEINRMVREVSIKSNISFQELWNQLYAELEIKAHCSLSRLAENKAKRMEKAGNTKTTIKESTTKLAVVFDDAKLKEIFTNLVKQYTIKYCA